MNAKEARAAAQKVVTERNRDYLHQFKSYLDSEISDAIKAGKTYCTKELQAGYDYRGEAEKAFKNHSYIKEVTKILDNYKKDGYIIEEGVIPQEHYSYSETNGSGFDCTTYTAFYTINW